MNLRQLESQYNMNGLLLLKKVCLVLLATGYCLGCGNSPSGKYSVVVTDQHNKPLADVMVDVTYQMEPGRNEVGTITFTDAQGVANTDAHSVASAYPNSDPDNAQAVGVCAIHPLYGYASPNAATSTIVLIPGLDIKDFGDTKPYNLSPSESAWAKYIGYLGMLERYYMERPFNNRAQLALENRKFFAELQRKYPLSEDHESVKQCIMAINTLETGGRM